MSRVCQICQKEYMKGNLVATGIGKRVSRRTIRKQLPNLRSKKLEINGQNIRVTLCASCLKRLKFDAAKALAAENATEVEVSSA
jgi:ribosomal protein L28